MSLSVSSICLFDQLGFVEDDYALMNLDLFHVLNVSTVKQISPSCEE